MKKLHVIVVLFFLMFAPITFQVVKSETFFIVATSESPCFESGGNESSLGSGNPENIDTFDEEPTCLTLQQFVTRFINNSYQNITTITLELGSGEHSLNSTLSVLNVTSFTMRSDAATITCSHPGVRLQLHYIEDVVIRRITFVGHVEIKISFVEQFRFENSSFQSSPNGSLILNHTMNATIIGSSFLEVTQSDCHKAAMTINKSSVLIQYCIFSKSQAVIYSTLSALTIDSCTFVNNSLIGCDEIILYDRTAVITTVNGPQTSETVTVSNCDFIDNRRVPVEDDSYGTNSVVFTDGSALILNNSFVNNTGFQELLHMETDGEYSQIVMVNNDILDNEIYDTAIHVAATDISITISHNNFTFNTASAVLLYVNNSTVTISDTIFFGNSKVFAEGAVTIGTDVCYSEHDCRESLNVSVKIMQCIFISNYFLEGALGINMDSSSVSITQSTFIDNLVSESGVGGAAITIDTNGSVSIDSCTFIENKGPRGGAVYIKRASSTLINHNNFSYNKGSRYRGAALTLEVDNALITINESYFYGNINTNFKLNRMTDKRYVSYGYAGTVYLVGTYNSLIIDNSSFINNSGNAINSWSLGEDRTPTGSFVIHHSNFTNNYANLFHIYGGIFLCASTIEIAETIFLNNSAKECGALSMQAHNIYITGSHFVHNSAVNYSGGAICTFQELHRIELKQMSISRSTFSHNYAGEDGGVFKMMTYSDGHVNATIHIRECIFDNNRADSQGGVFWTFPLEAFYISDSLFIKNQAGSDGGVAMIDGDYEMNGQWIISVSLFDQNIANTRGGVFSTFVPCKYLVDNSSFTGNQAGTDGGVMYVGSGSSQVRITNGSMFSFNNATARGGVILINRSRLEISDTTLFNDNFAGIGDDIIACNCDIIPTAFTLHNYTDPNFPNCTLYGHYEVTTADSLPTKPPAGYVVAMAVSIPIAFIVILLLLTATLLGACLCLRRRSLLKQYGVRRSDHSDFVPLMNNT